MVLELELSFKASIACVERYDTGGIKVLMEFYLNSLDSSEGGPEGATVRYS